MEQANIGRERVEIVKELKKLYPVFSFKVKIEVSSHFRYNSFYINHKLMSIKATSLNFAFWFHLLITTIAWVGPFVFNWQLMLIAYAIVQLQFGVLGKCVVNEHHDLDESDDYTFHAYLFEQLGFKVKRKKVRFFVRKISNWLFATVTIIWQILLGMKPLISFF